MMTQCLFAVALISFEHSERDLHRHPLDSANN